MSLTPDPNNPRIADNEAEEEKKFREEQAASSWAAAALIALVVVVGVALYQNHIHNAANLNGIEPASGNITTNTQDSNSGTTPMPDDTKIPTDTPANTTTNTTTP